MARAGGRSAAESGESGESCESGERAEQPATLATDKAQALRELLKGAAKNLGFDALQYMAIREAAEAKTQVGEQTASKAFNAARRKVDSLKQQEAKRAAELEKHQAATKQAEQNLAAARSSLEQAETELKAALAALTEQYVEHGSAKDEREEQEKPDDAMEGGAPADEADADVQEAVRQEKRALDAYQAARALTGQVRSAKRARSADPGVEAVGHQSGGGGAGAAAAAVQAGQRAANAALGLASANDQG